VESPQPEPMSRISLLGMVSGEIRSRNNASQASGKESVAYLTILVQALEGMGIGMGIGVVKPSSNPC
jgi:hypothetical protein